MSKSLLTTSLGTSTAVVAGVPISSLGSIIRRFGCDLAYNNGSFITERNAGYYLLTVNAVIEPAVVGDITMTITENGVPIASTTNVNAATGDPTPIVLSNIPSRVFCESAKNISVVFSGAGNVTSLIITAVKV